MKKIVKLLLLIATFILVSVVVYMEMKDYYLETLPIKLEQPEFFFHDKPNKELLLEACTYYQLEEKEIVVSQAILETGHFRSDNCIKNNNLFGLYNSKKKRYYKFNHWTESVVFYRDKIQNRRKPNEKYYDFLNRIGYAEDKEYISKVKNIKNRYRL